MSLRSLESAICSEARDILKNRKLRIKDMMEWGTAEIKAHDGEVVIRCELNDVWVAVKTECDKRTK